MSREYLVLGGEVAFTHRGERHVHAAQGARGGEPGALAHSAIHRANGSLEVIPSKRVTTLHAGDRLEVHTAGGGGFGDPNARSPEQRAADRANRKVGGT